MAYLLKVDQQAHGKQRTLAALTMVQEQGAPKLDALSTQGQGQTTEYDAKVVLLQKKHV